MLSAYEFIRNVWKLFVFTLTGSVSPGQSTCHVFEYLLQKAFHNNKLSKLNINISLVMNAANN